MKDNGERDCPFFKMKKKIICMTAVALSLAVLAACGTKTMEITMPGELLEIHLQDADEYIEATKNSIFYKKDDNGEIKNIGGNVVFVVTESQRKHWEEEEKQFSKVLSDTAGQLGYEIKAADDFTKLSIKLKPGSYSEENFDYVIGQIMQSFLMAQLFGNPGAPLELEAEVRDMETGGLLSRFYWPQHSDLWHCGTGQQK